MTGARLARRTATGVLATTGVTLIVRTGAVDLGLPIAVAAGGAAVASVVVLVARHRLRGDPVEERRDARPPLPAPHPGDAGRRRLVVAGGAGALLAAGGVLRWLVGRTRAAERALATTAWRAGVPLVDERGRRVRSSALFPGTITTVWPEGHVGEDSAQAVLIHLTPGQSVSDPGREEWTVGGFVAYSKLCTHMGCPVALYQQEVNVLVCPCHQATFDVLSGARPVLGPAGRPLPQLPLAVDEAEGVLIAAGDFSGVVGADHWGRGT